MNLGIWFFGFIIGLLYMGWRSVEIHLDAEDMVIGFAMSLFWFIVLPVFLSLRGIEKVVAFGAYLGREYYKRRKP